LASARHSSGPMHRRMIGNSFCAGLDRRLEPLGCGWIARGDVGGNLVEMFEGAFTPYDLQRAFRRAASIVFLIRAIASSCGTGGRGSASDSATFLRNHSS